MSSNKKEKSREWIKWKQQKEKKKVCLQKLNAYSDLIYCYVPWNKQNLKFVMKIKDLRVKWKKLMFYNKLWPEWYRGVEVIEFVFTKIGLILGLNLIDSFGLNKRSFFLFNYSWYLRVFFKSVQP